MLVCDVWESSQLSHTQKSELATILVRLSEELSEGLFRDWSESEYVRR